MRIPHWVFVVALLAISLSLHFGGIWYPKEAVFDEVHFGKFVSAYFTGEYYFDIHPPLGKLMVAGVAALSGFEPKSAFAAIGEPYPDYQYVWLRFSPALFGSLLAPLVYLLTLRIGMMMQNAPQQNAQSQKRQRLDSPFRGNDKQKTVDKTLTTTPADRGYASPGIAALLAGIFILFDNALLVQSKFILIDSFLLVFGLCALYFFLQSRDLFADGRWGMSTLAASAIFAGLALSIKWTGMAFAGTIGIFLFYAGIQRILARQLKAARFLKILIIFAAAPVIAYLLFFYIHFSLLPNSGTGDAFMKPRFHESRAAGYPTKDFLKNTWELNREMLSANRRLDARHSYSSQWYEWPLMQRSVYYWAKEAPAADQSQKPSQDGAARPAMDYFRIYLLGNPFVWWFSTIGIIVFFLILLVRVFAHLSVFLSGSSRRQNRIPRESALPQWFLAVAYLANLLPFLTIGRVMFLYHYLAAFIIAVIITALWLVRLKRFHKTALAMIVVLTITGFVIIAPITYGTALEEGWPSKIFWFKGWI